MFHPYSTQGGTATLDPQAASLNGQSRLPDMFGGSYPQNIAGSIPFTQFANTPVTGYPTNAGYPTSYPIHATLPGYGIPQYIQPGTFPAYHPTAWVYPTTTVNPTNPTYGYHPFNGFNPTTPFGGFPVPQTIYPTPFVNTLNPFVNYYNPFPTGAYNTIPTTFVNTPYGPVCCTTGPTGFNPFPTAWNNFPFRGGWNNFPTGTNATIPTTSYPAWNTGCTGYENFLGWNNPFATTINPMTTWNPFWNTTTPFNTFNPNTIPTTTPSAWNPFVPNYTNPTSFLAGRPVYGGFTPVNPFSTVTPNNPFAAFNPFATAFSNPYQTGINTFGNTPWWHLNTATFPVNSYGMTGGSPFPFYGFGAPTTPTNPTMATTTINPFSGVTNPFFNPTNIAYGIPGTNGQLNPNTSAPNCGPVCCN